jgi:hypothetical protein
MVQYLLTADKIPISDPIKIPIITLNDGLNPWLKPLFYLAKSTLSLLV